jgi:hypothetical protein
VSRGTRQPQIAIVAYGSLIYEPGEALAELVQETEPYRTPFSVEYGRQSKKWGGGPVLTVDPRGEPVDGQRMILKPGLTLGEVIDVLAAREGIPSAHGIIEIESPGALTELTCALPRNLEADDMAPAALAARAASSVSNGALNGVAYLRGAVGVGVRTARTDEYVAALLETSGGGDLFDAEARLLAFSRSEAPRET